MEIIPKIARNLCPEFKEKFITIEKIIQEMKKRLASKVKPEFPPHYPKLLWKFKIFHQLANYRCVDLAESILLNWKHKRIAASFVIIRSLFETAAILFDSSNQVSLLTKDKKFSELNELIERLTFSTRIQDFQPYKAINILTVIDRIDKQVPSFRYNYDNLCEYAHPNHFAFMGLYGNMVNEFECDFSFHTKADKNGVQILFSVLASIMSTAYIGIKSIEDNFDMIAKIAINYQTQLEKEEKTVE